MNVSEGKSSQHAMPTISAIVILVIIPIFAYSNCYSCPFIFDDIKDIVLGTHFHRIWPIWEVMFQIPPGTAASGRPMVGLTLAINYVVGGTDPFGYHLLNILIHIASTLLLYGIVNKTLAAGFCGPRFQTGAQWIALGSSLLWSVHPLQTESVTYIIKRNESMMGMFYLLTMYCFLRGVLSNNGRFWLGASFLSCLLGMATKETMVTAPVAVFLFDRCFVECNWMGPLRKRRWYYLAMALTWIPLSLLVAGSPRGKVGGFGVEDLSPWSYALTQSGVLLHYLKLALLPTNLCIDYFDWPIARNFGDVRIPALLVAGGTIATAIGLIKTPRAAFLPAFFLIVLSPSSSIVPIRELVCEYRMYLPLAAIAVAVATGIWWAIDKYADADEAFVPKCFVVIVLMITGVLGLSTYARNTVYQSPEVMWADVVSKRPDNYRARGNLAGYQVQRKEFAAAEQNHLAALRVKPDHFTSLLGMGTVCAQTNRPQEAERYFEAALKIEPNNPGALANRGILSASQREYQKALPDLEAAAKMRPDITSVLRYLAIVYEGLGRRDDAIRVYRSILAQMPDDAISNRELARLTGSRPN